MGFLLGPLWLAQSTTLFLLNVMLVILQHALSAVSAASRCLTLQQGFGQPILVTVQLNYTNKQMLLGAMIVAGWDSKFGGQVWGCPISGTLVRENWAIDGSGSTYIWGFLDSEFRSGHILNHSSICSCRFSVVC